LSGPAMAGMMLWLRVRRFHLRLLTVSRCAGRGIKYPTLRGFLRHVRSPEIGDRGPPPGHVCEGKAAVPAFPQPLDAASQKFDPQSLRQKNLTAE